MNKRILGIDPSLSSTGIVLLDAGRVVLHDCWKFPKLAGIPRLAAFEETLRDALQGMEPPAVAAIEGYSYGSQARGERLGELGGVFRLVLWRRGIPVEEWAPSTWKKALLGNGALHKDRIRLEVFKRYGVEFNSQDTLDAWCVAMAEWRRRCGEAGPAPVLREHRGLTA